MNNAFVWLHVSANIIWIGAILAVGVLIASKAVDPKVRGALAVSVYSRLAVPAFVVSFVFGVIRLLGDTNYYFKEHHWMHGKLLFALAVIGIHHVLGARAKKLASGATTEAGPALPLTIALGVCALAATFFVVMRLPD